MSPREGAQAGPAGPGLCRGCAGAVLAGPGQCGGCTGAVRGLCRCRSAAVPGLCWRGRGCAGAVLAGPGPWLRGGPTPGAGAVAMATPAEPSRGAGARLCERSYRLNEIYRYRYIYTHTYTLAQGESGTEEVWCGRWPSDPFAVPGNGDSTRQQGSTRPLLASSLKVTVSVDTSGRPTGIPWMAGGAQQVPGTAKRNKGWFYKREKDETNYNSWEFLVSKMA
ncbi:uncharacterized protein LOC128800490 [Vidua chalybeata]|uniref:uncharacterized protein LOC128800490 n=1 Tax=Vidua chalybeata TaxID=81927 RepID=UPI0023A8F695|nr:uncharacterized protein LOC128800490 [Vidua chalybeata]